MTVTSTARRTGPFAGNGVTTAVPFTFKVFEAADIEVTHTDANGVETVLTLNTHYSVAVNADQDTSPGGTLTYPVSGTPLPVGETITIVGATAYEQDLDISNAGRFLPNVIENALDKGAILNQQLKEKLGRALLFSVNDTDTEVTIPQAATRVGKYLAFDAVGAPVASAGTGADAGLRTDLAASSGSSLAGFLQAGVGAVARTMQGKARDVISAFDFMTPAQIADVVAKTALLDVTSAVQAFLDACRNGRGFMPRGKYKITSTLTLLPQYSYNIEGDAYDNGAADATVIYNASAAGGHAITIANTPFVTNYDSQIRFANLTVAGNALSGDGFNVDQTMVFLENVWISGHGGHGYYAQRCYSSAFRQVSFSNNYRNGFASNRALNAVHFDHCLFNGNAMLDGYAGCYLNGAVGADRNFAVTLTACDFTANGAALLPAQTAYGLVTQHCAGVSLVGCYAEGNHTYNLYADSTTSNLSVIGGFWQDSKVEISQVDGLIYENNHHLDSGAGSSQLNITGALPGGRKAMRIFGNTYSGTVTKSLTAGANENLLLQYSGPPSGGTWVVGDTIVNNNGQAGGACLGWMCTVAGTPGTWLPLGQIPYVYENHGDAAATLTTFTSFPTNFWKSPLTADRAVTLSATSAFSGAKFRIARTAASTGAFKLNVGTGPLKALDPGQWCDVEYNGAVWELAAFGSL